MTKNEKKQSIASILFFDHDFNLIRHAKERLFGKHDKKPIKSKSNDYLYYIRNMMGVGPPTLKFDDTDSNDETSIDSLDYDQKVLGMKVYDDNLILY